MISLELSLVIMSFCVSESLLMSGKCNIASILLATDLAMYPFGSESYLFHCILHTSGPYNWCSSFCLMSLNDFFIELVISGLAVVVAHA